MTDAIRAEFRRQSGGLVAMAAACALLIALSTRFLALASAYSHFLSVSGSTLLLGLLCVSLAGVICAISAMSSGRAESTAFVTGAEADATRRWLAHCCVGGAFAIGLACLVAALVVALCLEPGSEVPRWFLAVLSLHGSIFVALEAFAWAMFWSKPDRSPMLSFGLTAVSLILIWLVSTIGSEGLPIAIAASMAVRPFLACIVLYRSWRAAVLEDCPEARRTGVFRALAWKESREHRSVWLAMAGVNAAILLSAHHFLANDYMPLYWQIQGLTVVVVPAVYGLVCAGLMLAGESENRTLSCLDALTPVRTEVWKCKCLLGALFTAAQAVLSACFLLSPSWLLGHDLTKDLVDIAFVVTPIVVFALTVFAVGLFTSVMSRTVLGAVASGTLAAFLLGWFFANAPLRWVASPIDLLLLWGALVSALVYVSWLRFCRNDRMRRDLPDGDGENDAAGCPDDGRDSLWTIAKALSLGAAIGMGILIAVCCVLMPFFSSWQASLAVTIAVWLMVPARSFLNAAWGSASNRSSLHRIFRAAPIQAMLAAAAIAAGMFFLVCLLELYLAGPAASPFLNEAIMQILPAAAVLFTSWWLLCRGNQKAYRLGSPGWLLVAWLLFAGAEIVYAREATGMEYRSRRLSNPVAHVARELPLRGRAGTLHADRAVLAAQR